MIFVSVEPVNDKLVNIDVENENYSVSRMYKKSHLIIKVFYLSFLLILKILFSPYKSMDNRNGRM